MTKEARLHNVGKTVSSTVCTGQTVQLHVNNEIRLTLYKITSSKWIKNLNVRPDTMKPLGKNIGRTLSDKNHSNIFFNFFSPRIMKIKTEINKQYLH